MGVEIELWDIMRSISNWKTLMLTYWYEFVLQTNLQVMGYEIAKG
jgi:hypothetical protein